MTERIPLSAATVSERIAGYSYRFWMRAGMTEWPTVRQTARALRIRQLDIEECSSYGHYGLTAFNTIPEQSLGEHFVEAETPEVEVAWCGYWLPYSDGCYCGQHRALAEGR